MATTQKYVKLNVSQLFQALACRLQTSGRQWKHFLSLRLGLIGLNIEPVSIAHLSTCYLLVKALAAFWSRHPLPTPELSALKESSSHDEAKNSCQCPVGDFIGNL